MAVGLAGIDNIEKSAWYQVRAPYIPLLAALHWQSQIPREMLVKQAIAFAELAAASVLLEPAASIQ